MILIVGGAFQHKLCYVLKTFKISPEAVCNLGETDIDFSKKIIYNYHMMKPETGSVFAYTKAHRELLMDKIIITNETGAGIVPIERCLRERREDIGRANAYLAQCAQRVDRVVCGIGMTIKGGSEQ